jgi:hypothetical protein
VAERLERLSRARGPTGGGYVVERHFLMATEHVAAGQGGRLDRDVGAVEPVGRSRGYEYSIADAGLNLSTGQAGVSGGS